MKKIITVVMVICLFLSCASAETVDLSAMSYDQLLALRSQINTEIISRPEWKEVTVPAGAWIVGADIPEGFYCIKSTHSQNLVQLNDSSDYSELYKYLNEGEIVGKAEFKKGLVFNCHYEVILTPAVSLGF